MSQSGKTVTVAEEELAPCMCHIVAAQGDGELWMVQVRGPRGD